MTKVAVLSPSITQLTLLTQYLFNLARYDASYDVRDRGRLLSSLLRGVLSEKDEQDLGGVVLRREQVKAVLLGMRQVAGKVICEDSELEAGSMSRVLKMRMAGYEALPEWSDDPTDSTLRDSEVRPHPWKPTSIADTPARATEGVCPNIDRFRSTCVCRPAPACLLCRLSCPAQFRYR
jgi:AP-3 complex subunit beta